MTDRESGVSDDQRLANEGHRRLKVSGQQEEDGEIVDDWVGTVELAGTVTVPPLSARIARCRVVRRDDLTEVKVPRNQVVMVDPECLPGIYVARIVATLEVCDKSSFTDAPGWNLLVGKSPLVVSPQKKCKVAGSDSGKCVASSNGKTGTGENHSQLPEGGLSCTATVPGSDLQQVRRSLPIENKFSTQVETHQNYLDSARCIGQMEVLSNYESNERRTRSARESLIGYVPIQILNLSLEEVKLNKLMYVGLASPTQSNEIIKPDNQEVSVVHGVNELSEISSERRETSGKPDNQEGSVVHGVKKISNKRREFNEYLNEKLVHLKDKERRIL